MITAENLNFKIKDTPVLNDINFDIHNGEIFGITGPAGCGKSTLLKLLCGKLKPSLGSVNSDGRSISNFNGIELRKRITLLSTCTDFNPEATIFEEVIRGRHHLKKMLNPYSEIDRELTYNLIDEAGLSAHSDRRLKKLSDSFVRMTLIARTLNSDTGITGFDSPEAGLDPAQIFTVSRIIKKYVRKGGKSAIIASSDIAFLSRICDRIIVLKSGYQVEYGSIGIITEELIKNVLGINTLISRNLVTGLPEIQIVDID